jgi:hypothetical protein
MSKCVYQYKLNLKSKDRPHNKPSVSIDFKVYYLYLFTARKIRCATTANTAHAIFNVTNS